jgi:RNA polymerase sigma-70 factor, ECF subfamily
MNISEDDRNVEKFIHGDDRAFEALFQKYRNPLFSYIFYMVQEKQAAEDIFQETWMRIIKSISRYRRENRFSRFLYRVAGNGALDYLRKRRKGMEVAISGNDEKNPLDEMVIADSSQSPEALAEKKDLCDDLMRAIRALPAEQRQVVLLREYFNLPFIEVARVLDCSLNTALGRMHYAFRNLRKYLDDYKAEVLSR